MITSLEGYPAIVAARKAEKDRKPCFALSPEQEKAREIDRSHLNIVVRMIVDIARHDHVNRLVSKRSVRRQLITNPKLGQTHDDREAMFERAWAKAASTPHRMYIDDVDDPDRFSSLRRDNKPRTARRSARPPRHQRRAA